MYTFVLSWIRSLSLYKKDSEILNSESQVRKFKFSDTVPEKVGPLSVFTRLMIVNSLVLPVYEKRITIQCADETVVLEAQERQHSVAHAFFNLTYSEIINLNYCSWLVDTIQRKILKTFCPFIWEFVFSLVEVGNCYLTLDDFKQLEDIQIHTLKVLTMWHQFEEYEHGVEYGKMIICRYSLLQRAFWYPLAILLFLVNFCVIPPLLVLALPGSVDLYKIFFMIVQNVFDQTVRDVCIAVMITCGYLPNMRSRASVDTRLQIKTYLERYMTFTDGVVTLRASPS